MTIFNKTRRSFLKMAGIAASAMALPAKIFPAQSAIQAAPADKSPVSSQLRMFSGILRLYDEFDTKPDGKAPLFEYEFTHAGLGRLRDKYKLDAAAGNGDDWQKAVNLMNWMKAHVSYRADITSAKPEVCRTMPMNAAGLLEYSFDKGADNGINCYMHSIIFTEICLAVGIKCRIISLNPLSPFDYDNHLVNVVWHPKLKKWVMADTSYNGYLRNEAGMLLNPWEIRDLLSRQKTVLSNDELDYNGVKNNTEDYLRYLAKNLVYMHSPTFSGYDSINTSDKPWLTLTPKHFDVCKREAYNMKWRMEGAKTNWDKEELEKLLQKECYLVTTSSIASFAQSPD